MSEVKEPERIWIAPMDPCEGEDDYYVMHPLYRRGRGTEYVRADLVAAQPADAIRSAARRANIEVPE